MAEISGQLFGVNELRAALDKAIVQATAHARDAVAETAALVEKQAKLDATGRPGPIVRTGTLRRSIITEGPVQTGLSWRARIGPTVIYGRRVELGFVGADSLGRVYDQPGRPYLGPAYDYVVRFFPSIFARHMRAAVT